MHINKGVKKIWNMEAIYRLSVDAVSVFTALFSPFEDFIVLSQAITANWTKPLKNSSLNKNSESLINICHHLIPPLFTRWLQQTIGTCFFGRWSVHEADRCPSSALKPAGPACWVPESKGADPGPALTSHPDLRCPRGQTPDNLWVKRHNFYFILWPNVNWFSI